MPFVPVHDDSVFIPRPSYDDCSTIVHRLVAVSVQPLSKQRGVCGELGWVWVSCSRFPTQNYSQPTKKSFAVGKGGPCATFQPVFLGVGFGLGLGSLSVS